MEEQIASPESMEQKREKINRLMEKISDSINKECPSLVDSEGRIDMDAFEANGIYDNEKVALDKLCVQNQEEFWSGADDEDTVEKKKEALDIWRKEQEDKESLLFEKIAHILFYKILGKEFLVARTSSRDDQKRGIDHFFVDKDTGEIVCGIDAVETDNINPKKLKVREIDENGGATIEYGAVYNPKTASIERKKIEHIPLFYLGISKKEFRNLLANMSEDIGHPSETELEFFGGMIRSMETQREALLKDENIRSKIKENLKKSDMTLARMKGIRYERFGY
ncbi:hypothetical protein A2Y83_05220 [Candidatus Falkowbacteria bacterium RBG_13_39_14]|uniref:Uncharacterized protein n=1 Tax=Candidatus Falkowbacteria bacterium RBG_13_39_14 TaxID=1797985 RepID=A0A1F5S4X6_9BACT|nr:MAG: hypothetical protein A2Y83_05220 [Candidatus Falkowbacteria bacterium RBG_13_39_14]